MGHEDANLATNRGPVFGEFEDAWFEAGEQGNVSTDFAVSPEVVAQMQSILSNPQDPSFLDRLRVLIGSDLSLARLSLQVRALVATGLASVPGAAMASSVYDRAATRSIAPNSTLISTPPDMTYWVTALVQSLIQNGLTLGIDFMVGDKWKGGKVAEITMVLVGIIITTWLTQGMMTDIGNPQYVANQFLGLNLVKINAIIHAVSYLSAQFLPGGRKPAYSVGSTALSQGVGLFV